MVLFLVFPNVFCIILLLNGCCHSSLGKEGLGMPRWIKLCQELNVSLNTASCFRCVWGNAPLMPGKKSDIIQFPICPHSLLSKPDGYFLGGRWVSPPPAEALPSVCGGRGYRVSGEFSLWPVSACCWKEAASLHKVAHNSRLSSGLRALQTERVRTVVSLQLPGHRPPFPGPVCLHPAPARSVIRALRNCWHVNGLRRIETVGEEISSSGACERKSGADRACLCHPELMRWCVHLEAGIDEMAKRELLGIKTDSEERKSEDV